MSCHEVAIAVCASLHKPPRPTYGSCCFVRAQEKGSKGDCEPIGGLEILRLSHIEERHGRLPGHCTVPGRGIVLSDRNLLVERNRRKSIPAFKVNLPRLRIVSDGFVGSNSTTSPREKLLPHIPHLKGFEPVDVRALSCR
ncbi:hypothetical protein KC344_g161 [Hortaea werneckii]|nr:hypothetical protein KC344_g161 [Hortaea werneckii]